MSHCFEKWEENLHQLNYYKCRICDVIAYQSRVDHELYLSAHNMVKGMGKIKVSEFTCNDIIIMGIIK